MKIVVVDLTEGSMETLYDPNPEWREVDLTTVERFKWTDPFGIPIHLFANAGMMVLDVARLSANASTLETTAMDFAGLVAAVDLLHDRGLIDRNRIGMGGLSYAARLTNYAQINSDLLAAAVVSVLLNSEAEYYLGSEYLREFLADDGEYGGAPSADPNTTTGCLSPGTPTVCPHRRRSMDLAEGPAHRAETTLSQRSGLIE
jgi:hypothetical protein